MKEKTNTPETEDEMMPKGNALEGSIRNYRHALDKSKNLLDKVYGEVSEGREDKEGHFSLSDLLANGPVEIKEISTEFHETISKLNVALNLQDGFFDPDPVAIVCGNNESVATKAVFSSNTEFRGAIYGMDDVIAHFRYLISTICQTDIPETGLGGNLDSLESILNEGPERIEQNTDLIRALILEIERVLF